MPKKNMLRRNVQCRQRERLKDSAHHTQYIALIQCDCRPILNAILHKQKFTVWFSWNVSAHFFFSRKSFLLMVFLMKFYFIAIVGSLSSFTFHRSMVDGKFIGIVFGVMAFVHESHESRFMISVGVLTKEPKSACTWCRYSKNCCGSFSLSLWFLFSIIFLCGLFFMCVSLCYLYTN